MKHNLFKNILLREIVKANVFVKTRTSIFDIRRNILAVVVATKAMDMSVTRALFLRNSALNQFDFRDTVLETSKSCKKISENDQKLEVKLKVKYLLGVREHFTPKKFTGYMFTLSKERNVTYLRDKPVQNLIDKKMRLRMINDLQVDSSRLASQMFFDDHR